MSKSGAFVLTGVENRGHIILSEMERHYWPAQPGDPRN